MIEFTWKLRWRVSNLVANDTDIIPVYDERLYIGNCKISIHETDIMGHFDLRQDFDREKYVLYSAAPPVSQNDNWLLDGIRFVAYYDGVEKHAMPVSDMTP